MCATIYNCWASVNYLGGRGGGGWEYILEKHRCVNKCHDVNLCVNGEVCQEICDLHSTRFMYLPRHSPRPVDCMNKAFSVCFFRGMESESGFPWTLIQSFSFCSTSLTMNL